MPWGPEDVNKHNKNVSGSSKAKWARIANSVLAQTGDEAMAIRIANSRVKPSNNEAIKRRLNRG